MYCIGGKCYETSKEIFEKYFEVRSSLGAPIAPDTGAWEQFGEIRKAFVSFGSVDGKLGFPTGGIAKSKYFDDVIYQYFEKGTIYYNTGEDYFWMALGVF